MDQLENVEEFSRKERIETEWKENETENIFEAS